MNVVKKRNKNKWILPKNNKSIERHQLYVSFVVNFASKNNRYPTIDEYIAGIVSFLVEAGSNKKGAATAKYHQLYQPVFFSMLKIVNDLVVPTEIGLAFMSDIQLIYLSTTLFWLMNNATFATGTTSTSTAFDAVRPVKILFDNLNKYGSVSFSDLNTKFHTKNQIIDLVSEDSLSGFTPQWTYIIYMLKEAGLISTTESISNINLKNKNYNPNGMIKATEVFYDQYANNQSKIAQMITDVKNEDIVIEAKAINEDERYFEFLRSKDNKIESQILVNKTVRDASAQAAYRNMLIERDKSCKVCGIENKFVLRASHIKPYSTCNEQESFDVNNGLLLCTMHDALFDKGLITFTEGKLTFSPLLTKQDLEIIKLLSIKEKINIPNKEISYYLEFHKENIFKSKK